MARMARLVMPGVPHHVTQRGNGRAATFFGDDDYALYRNLLSEHCAAAGVEVWAWVLMPNHVHLILTPSDEDGLRAALTRTHRRYAGHIHAREKRSGHLCQGRFGCVAMDESHLSVAIRHLSRPWSAAAAGPSPRRDVDANRRQILTVNKVHCHRFSGIYRDPGAPQRQDPRPGATWTQTEDRS